MQKVVVFFVFLALTGCKLAVMVTSGGEVISQSGTHNCAGANLCEIDIADANFTETFTAVARPGYQFEKWKAGDGNLCAESTDPTCTFTLPGGVIGSLAVATYETVFLVPKFRDVGIDTDQDGTPDRADEDDDNDGVLDVDDVCPLDPNPNCGQPIEKVVIGTTEWAQVDLFSGVTWSDVNSVCAEGTCNGQVNGYDMTGWKWASVDEIKFLFNVFIGANTLYPGVDIYNDPFPGFLSPGIKDENGDPWDYCVRVLEGASIFDFRTTYLDSNACDLPAIQVSGFVRGDVGTRAMLHWGLVPELVGLGSTARIHYGFSLTPGAWFYRKVIP